MNYLALSIRNFKEMYLDLVALGLVMIFPPVLLLVLQTIGSVDPFFNVSNLTPGTIIFGFAFLSLASGMVLAKDRENGFLTRLLSAPLKSSDFILAYTLPYLPVAILQMILGFVVGSVLGIEIVGSLWLVILIFIVMAVGYIGIGMILGALFSYKTVSIAWIVINLLTVFGGAWFPLEMIGGPIRTTMNLLPFAHAIEASRDVILYGAGFGDVLTDLYWITGYTIVFFAIGIVCFKRKMIEK